MSDVELLYRCSIKLFTIWWPVIVPFFGYLLWEYATEPRIRKSSNIR